MMVHDKDSWKLLPDNTYSKNKNKNNEHASQLTILSKLISDSNL